MSYSDSYINRTASMGSLVMIDNLPDSMRKIEDSLLPIINEFDAIVVSGLSGIIPGAIFAHKHNKQLVVVRKDDDVTHGVRTEGRDYITAKTPYVILDDFVSSGTTLNRIMTALYDLDYSPPKYLVMYRAHSCNTRSVRWGERDVMAAWEHHNLYRLVVVRKQRKKAA